jgi:hypothetical protein
MNLAVWARRFEFDHCYWSSTRDDHYADQATLFQDLGRSMLESAWQVSPARCFLVVFVR